MRRTSGGRVRRGAARRPVDLRLAEADARAMNKRADRQGMMGPCGSGTRGPTGRHRGGVRVPGGRHRRRQLDLEHRGGRVPLLALAHCRAFCADRPPLAITIVQPEQPQAVRRHEQAHAHVGRDGHAQRHETERHEGENAALTTSDATMFCRMTPTARRPSRSAAGSRVAGRRPSARHRPCRGRRRSPPRPSRHPRGGGQRGRVVDAVADHRHRAVGLQRARRRELVLGQQRRVPLVDADSRRDGAARASSSPVSITMRSMPAGAGRRRRPAASGRGCRPGRTPRAARRPRRAMIVVPPRSARRSHRGRDRAPSARAPDADRPPTARGRRRIASAPRPGQGEERASGSGRRGRARAPPAPAPGRAGAPSGARPSRRARSAVELVRRRDVDARAARRAGGQRPGLVEATAPDAREGLERLAALDQHAAAGGAADGGDDGDGDGDHQRARARDDQQRERAVHPGVERRRRAASGTTASSSAAANTSGV